MQALEAQKRAQDVAAKQVERNLQRAQKEAEFAPNAGDAQDRGQGQTGRRDGRSPSLRQRRFDWVMEREVPQNCSEMPMIWAHSHHQSPAAIHMKYQ
jgi:hypothetical protein